MDYKSHPLFPPFPDGGRVAFYGDSITRLGGGVLRVAAQYRELFPGRDVRFFNAGISGGGLPDAAFYFDGWIAPFMPTHVVLAFGVNDANAIARGRLADAAVEASRLEGALVEFRKRYATLVGRVELLGAKAILRAITPFDNTVRADEAAVPPDPFKADLYRRVADEIRALAADCGLPCIDDWTRMSELLESGEDDFMPDRVHPVEHGQWRLAENLLAGQGLTIAPFRSREETAEAAGLAEWDGLSQRVANILSAERTFVRDETLDVPSRMAKVRAWLNANENSPGVHPVLIRFARDYLRDKPREDELRAHLYVQQRL